MYRRISGVALMGLISTAAWNVALGSELGYSTCPGYPNALCPSGGSEQPIPDNNANGIVVDLYVPSDGEDFITDVNAWFFITHTYQGDLRVVLTSPAGWSVELVNRPGSPGCGTNGFSADDFGYINQISLLQEFELDDSAAASYNTPQVACNGIPAVAGAWRPVLPLSAFYGQSKVGTWKLYVQDLLAQDVGSLGVWGLTIRTEPATAPVVDIATPDDYACACASGAITGTARDPDGTFDGYTLQWAVDSAGPWNLITSSNTSLNPGVLGTFPAPMPDGNSYVRLIAANAIGMSSTFVKVIHQDRAFSSAVILDPQDDDIIGGNVRMDRVGASDYCFASAALAYAPAGSGQFTTFFSTTNPVNEFPPWNTGGLPDGDYTLRVTGTTTCGHSASDSVVVTLDNTAPVAVITSPVNCEALGGLVNIMGTVSDAHLGGWVLQYTGGSENGWQTIASGDGGVDGPLAAWDTTGLPACTYTLRLLANDASLVECLGSNGSEFLVSVKLGGSGECSGDLDGDGDVDLLDYADFSACMTGSGGGCQCP